MILWGIPDKTAYLSEERASRVIEDNPSTLFNATSSCSEVFRAGWGKNRSVIKPCSVMSLAVVVCSPDELDTQ